MTNQPSSIIPLRSTEHTSAHRPVRVFLVCPGLGHVSRGFETFTAECFEALRDDCRLDFHLFKGAGPVADRDHTVWCLRRDRVAARMLGPTIRRDAYYVEQTTFALALLPHLVRLRPDVVYYSDGVVGNLLWRWRRLCRKRFKLLLSNGGPLGPPDFPRIDHVHQVSGLCYEESLRAGRPVETQTLLPYGFRIDPYFHPLSRDDRAALRHKLGLPAARPVVLSVGAINSSHKRMDYIIREINALAEPRPFLLMLGQRDPETPGILELAAQQLGPIGFECRTVSPNTVPDYYDASDVFVLGSLSEGFSRAMGEAHAHGLPCLVADRGHARFVLGQYGNYADLSRNGELARSLSRLLEAGPNPSRGEAQHVDAYERLSWDRLAPLYAEMIVNCARGVGSVRN